MNRVRQIYNDPKTMNILAWFLGGSFLLSSTAGVYYTRTRVKQNEMDK